LGSANEQAEYNINIFSTKCLKDRWHHSCTEILEGVAGALLIFVASLCTTVINVCISKLTPFISL
jgi:hypothetical protein